MANLDSKNLEKNAFGLRILICFHIVSASAFQFHVMTDRHILYLNCFAKVYLYICLKCAPALQFSDGHA